MSRLQLKSVALSFSGQSIINSISLRCSSGEVIGILGESGVGKTTILNLICGYLQPEVGQISVCGKPASTAAREQLIGYVFQQPTLIPWLSAIGNVLAPLQLHQSEGEDSETNEQRAMLAMRRMKIEHAIDKLPSELSGGMQTRVGLARAIVYHPELLLLDEPFSSLDDMVSEQLYMEIQDLVSDYQPATVLVTHNLIEAIQMCDRIYILKSDGEQGATIVAEESIELPRPRSMEIIGTEQFSEVWNKIRGHLA